MKVLFVVCLVICLGVILVPGSNTAVPVFSSVNHSLEASKPGVVDKTPLPVLNLKKPPDRGNIPLYFIPNQGQVSKTVLFYAKTPDYSLWLTYRGMAFNRIVKKNNRPANDFSRLNFIGANRKPEIKAEGTTDHRVSYFKGNVPVRMANQYPHLESDTL